MTETVSHIAAKNLSKGERVFTILPDISIDVDENDCLVVKAPKLTPEVLYTNDVVTLVSNDSFIWLGRFDNVMNSGGYKNLSRADRESPAKSNQQSILYHFNSRQIIRAKSNSNY